MDLRENKYLVGVRCVTYQHEKFIKDALDGFAMQQTDFPFLVMLIDDASTDGTQDVINRFLEDNFVLGEENFAWRTNTDDAVTTFARHKKNTNCHILSLNLKVNLWKNRAKKDSLLGDYLDSYKYLALCEGDDYWTDPLKLQKQVDILEKDETLMACCTNCSVVDMEGNVLEEKRVQPVVKENKQGRYSLRDFFNQGHQYPTLSVLYRNTHQDEVRQKTNAMRNPYMGDWTLWIALLCFGDMYYLDEVTCAYRINPTSLTHDQSKMNQRRLGQAKDNFRLIPLVASCLPDDYQDKKDDLINNTAWMWYRLAIAYKHVGQYFRMAYALLRCELKDPGYVRREISLAKKKL